MLHCATKFYDLHKGNVSKFVRGSTGREDARRSLSGNESNLSLLDRYWALKGGEGGKQDSNAREKEIIDREREVVVEGEREGERKGDGKGDGKRE